MIKPGIYKFLGGRSYVRGIKVFEGNNYIVEQQGTQHFKGEDYIKVIITSHPVTHTQGVCLYRNEGAFNNNWKYLFER